MGGEKNRWALLGRYSRIAQGVSPGLGIKIYSLSLDEGGTTPRQIRTLKVPLLKELNSLLSAYTQGFILGFALITPWALQECRA